MRAHERFINYAMINTQSRENSPTAPSTARQLDLARVLEKELLELGASDVRLTDKGCLYARLPATEGLEDKPCLGFIAHMDTSPDFSGENVRPRIIENYDGGEVALGTSGRVLSPAMFPNLEKLRGRTLIVTDGSTLLGADDKAGIAEIMTLVEELQTSKTPHGPIAVAFTPDEEVGRGTENFDIPAFGADFAYTLDGGTEGEIVFENFNACVVEFAVKGVNVHPGEAKNVMVNAALLGMELNSMLPSGEIPAKTEGREGFFHLISMSGDVESASVRYIVRDHDAALYEGRKQTLRHIESLMNEKYGPGTVTLTIREQYRNMAEMIKPDYWHLVENAIAAIEKAGVTPVQIPIRGGTDGAMLSWEGLPCPNLGTAGHAFHGPYEHITVEGMDKCVEIIKNIVEIYSK